MNHQDKEKSLWEEIVKDLRAQGNVAEYGFETYISELSLKKDTGTKLIIEYPAGMLVEWIEFYYAADITMSASRVLKAARELEFIQAELPTEQPVEPSPVMEAEKPSPVTATRKKTK